MKCYIAGAWADAKRIAEARTLMQSVGWEVTSQWIDLALTNGGSETTNDWAAAARRDYEDIDRSQVVIVDILSDHTKGGREWEGGYAVGTNKLAYVVGPPRTPFLYAVSRRFDSWEECASVLKQPPAD